MKNDEYININKVAEAKGLTSNRSLRIAIQKGKYIAREVTVQGGKSYEIKYSSLEVEVQEKLEDEEIKSKSTALVPINNINNRINFVSENARLTALARVDIISALETIRKRYPTKKEADSTFIDLYNSGLYLPQIYKFMGTITIGTLYRWIKKYEDYGYQASRLGIPAQQKLSQQYLSTTYEVFILFLSLPKLNPCRSFGRKLHSYKGKRIILRINKG